MVLLLFAKKMMMVGMSFVSSLATNHSQNSLFIFVRVGDSA